MDCERFESAMMDELYGELDELTSAAAKRHVAGCARCASLIGGLRATREVASLPLEEPPADLEERILAAARDAQKVVRPLDMKRKIARAISIAGRWAMQPQAAVAAVFLVMIGTSVLLIRGKASRAPDRAEVTVTQEGSPSPVASASAGDSLTTTSPTYMAATPKPLEGKAAASAATPPSPTTTTELSGALATKTANPSRDDGLDNSVMNAGPIGGAPPPATLPPAPTAAAETPGAGGGGRAYAQQQAIATSPPADEQQKRKALTPFDTALQAYQAARYDDATKQFDALAASDVTAALWAARSVREGKGCKSALARFDAVAQRATGTPNGWDALLEGALCYRAVGNFGQARLYLTSLLKVDAYKDRAQAELDRLNQAQGAGGQGQAPASRAAPAAPKKPAADTDSAY